jgi:holo-[acyl-carrier protein] synthase
MILGIGIDQCEVGRMQRQLAAAEDGFVTSVFLPDEISYCTNKHRPAKHFAARFAAKEAAIKALASAGGQGTFWHDIEITSEPDGRPLLVLSGRLGELADRLGVCSLHVSLTHTADLAAAVVIAEG